MNVLFHSSFQARPAAAVTISSTLLTIFARLSLLLLISGLLCFAGCGSNSGSTQPTATATPARPARPVALDSLHMIDATNGWALAWGRSILLRTTSGPLHWQDVTPHYDVNTFIIAASDFLDIQHAWVTVAPIPGLGAPSQPLAIWHTGDGGQHWQQSLIHSQGYAIGAPFFLTPQLGWVTVERVLGGNKTNGIGGLDIFRTQDGGMVWTLVSTTSNGPHVDPGVQRVALAVASIVFISPTQGWLVGSVAILRQDGGTNPLRIYRTQDGGVTWQPQELPLTSSQVSSVDLVSPTFFHGGVEGIIPAFVATSNGGILALYTTQDGGASWSVASPAVPRGVSFININFVDRQHGWVSSDRLYRTEDGGQHWTAFPLPEEASSESFWQMDFVSETLGWAVSGARKTKEALLFQTTDGGQSWQVLAPTSG